MRACSIHTSTLTFICMGAPCPRTHTNTRIITQFLGVTPDLWKNRLDVSNVTSDKVWLCPCVVLRRARAGVSGGSGVMAPACVCSNHVLWSCDLSSSCGGDGAGAGVMQDAWRSFFTKRGFGGQNVMIFGEEYYPHMGNSRDSITSRIGVVLFRIRNVGTAVQQLRPIFWYTHYVIWGDIASVALNGVSVWNSATTSNYWSCQMCGPQQLTLNIPPGRVSTIMFAVGSGGVSTTRTMLLSFIDNSLALHPDLFWVDDLDIATGGWDE
jgi:hypothetical protein